MSDRKSQCARILALLQEHADREVSLVDILELKISQYGARISELREEGYEIRNRTEWQGRRRKSWFMLVTDSQVASVEETAVAETAPQAVSGEQQALFG